MSDKQKSPYYAVIFTSKRSKLDLPAYSEMAEKMAELAKTQSGFLGMKSVRRADEVGITVSYWKTKEDILTWKKNSEHLEAQKSGRASWYDWYDVKICLVEQEYKMESPSGR